MAKGALMGGLTALALAVVVVAYTVVASKLDRWWITGAMVVATGVILGPGGLDVLPFSLANETVLTITELTLALLLFSDASTVRLREVEGDVGLPRRLLFVGLPLTVIGARWCPPHVSRGRVGVGRLGRDRPGPDRRRAGAGGGDQQGGSGADPTSVECRERPQRWDCDASGDLLRRATVAFMGWFGPRGLGSVVFTLLALEEIEHSGDGSMLLATVTWTILGFGGAAWYLGVAAGCPVRASIARAGTIPETTPAAEPQIRLHDLAGRHDPQRQQTPEPR